MFKRLKRRRDQIIEEIRQIVRMRRGGISTQHYTKINRSGEKVRQGPYYVLQGWRKGRHYSQRIRAEEIPATQEAIEGYERFKKLSEEFVEITEQMTQQDFREARGKKKPRKSRPSATGKPKRSSK